MNRVRYIIAITFALILSIFVFMSFGEHEKIPYTTKRELYAFLMDKKNNLIKADSMEKVKYVLCYKPEELIASTIFSSASNDKKKVNSLFFILQVSYEGNDLLHHSNVPYNYKRVLNNISFNLEKYLYVVIDKQDTLALCNSSYSRLYGQTNQSSLLLYFQSKMEFELCEVFVKDFVFETDDILKFKFKNEDIKKCPHLINKN